MVVPAVVVVAYKAVVEYVREVAGYVAAEHEVDNLVGIETVAQLWAAVVGDCNIVDCGYRFPDWEWPVCLHVPSSKTFVEPVLLDADGQFPEIYVQILHYSTKLLDTF